MDAEKCPIKYVPPYAVLSKLPTATLPNTTINFQDAPVSTMLDWSDEFSERESKALAGHLKKITEIFPELEELNLANHLQFAQLPDFNRALHLRKINISHNRIGHSPWAIFQDMSALESLDLSWNRLAAKHFQMRKDRDGITCRMLEQFRLSIQKFDVRFNLLHYLGFGIEYEKCVDAYPIGEQEMLSSCPQGARNVLLGVRHLVRYVMPSLSGLSFKLAHFSNGTDGGCFSPVRGEKILSLNHSGSYLVMGRPQYIEIRRVGTSSSRAIAQRTNFTQVQKPDTSSN